MNRPILLMLTAVVLTLLLAGCGGGGGGGDTGDLVPADIAAEILEQVPFKNTLTLAEGDVASNFYALDDNVTEHAIYIDGSGATAEEVCVLKAASPDDAQYLRDIINKRLEKLTFSFQSYRPGEMTKINSPVIVTKGSILVFVTADDPDLAEEVVMTVLGS